jgi:hypothetical protein
MCKKIIFVSSLMLMFFVVGLVFSTPVFAALLGSQCNVTAKVIAPLASESEDTSTFIKLINISEENSCLVEEGQVFEISRSNPLEVGGVISAGIEPSSTNGPEGVISFLHWSNVTYLDGTDIVNTSGAVFNSFTSSNIPVKYPTADINPVPENSDLDLTYYYFVLPFVTVVFLLIIGFYIFKRFRS